MADVENKLAPASVVVSNEGRTSSVSLRQLQARVSTPSVRDASGEDGQRHHHRQPNECSVQSQAGCGDGEDGSAPLAKGPRNSPVDRAVVRRQDA